MVGSYLEASPAGLLGPADAAPRVTGRTRPTAAALPLLSTAPDAVAGVSNPWLWCYAAVGALRVGVLPLIAAFYVAGVASS